MSNGEGLVSGLFQVAGAVAGLAPGLAALVTVVQTIYATCDNVSKNQREAHLLAEFSRAMVETIAESLNEVESGHSKFLLEGMHSHLLEVNKVMQLCTRRSAWKIWIQQDQIRQRIEDVKLKMILLFAQAFLVTSLGLQAWAARFAKGQQQQHAYLEKIAKVLETSGKTGEDLAAQRRADSQAHAGRPSVGVGARKTLLQVQVELRLCPESSPRRAELLKQIQDMHCSSEPLPLTDLEGEVNRIGDQPVHVAGGHEVWRGLWLGNGDAFVALKCIRATGKPTAARLNRLHRQVQLAAHIRHAYILPIYGACYTAGSISLVTPWQKNGSIMEYLARSPNADRLVLVHQLALAIQHLHAQPKPLVHGAVQPSNILISDAGTVQLADFATAKVLESLADSAQNTMTSGSTSNLRWMAPELIEGQYGTPADVWGWAITSLQILTDLAPFFQIKQAPSVAIRASKGLRPLRQDYDTARTRIRDELWALFEQCWKGDPAARPGIGHVVESLGRCSV